MKCTNSKGITLISLVVTIIVLIILASITIGTLSGDNGIIVSAQNAKNVTIEGEKQENDTLGSYLNQIDSTVNFNQIDGSGNTGGDSGNDEGDNTEGNEGDSNVHTHNYSILMSTTKATCTAEGSEIYKCSSCESTQTTQIAKDPNNHTGGTRTEYVYVSDTAHSKNTVCSSCGEVLSTKSEAHTNNGSGTCPDCLHDITSNHTHSYTVFVEQVSAATCTAQVRNKYACSVCGATTTISEGSLLEHSWNSGEITTEPTTTTEGIRTYTCSVCKGTKTEAIEKLNAIDVNASGYNGTYDGLAHGITVSSTVSDVTITYSTTENGTFSSVNPTYTNAGTYTTYYKLEKQGYETATGSKTVVINKAENNIGLSATSVTLNTSTTSKTITVTSAGDGKITAESSDTSVANVSVSGSNITINSVNNTSGTATITINVAEGTNYKAGNITCNVTASFIIPISTVPSQSGSLTYSGSAQSPTWSNYDSSKMTIGGTTSGTNAGTYTATFTPKSGYCWSDGSTTAKSVSWAIDKKVISCSKKTIGLQKYYTGGVVRLKLSYVDTGAGITTSDVHVTVSPSKWAYFRGTWYDDGTIFYSKDKSSGYGCGICHTDELNEWQQEHYNDESITYTVTVNFYNDNYYWDCSATLTVEEFGYLDY